MITEKLISMLETQSDELTRSWIALLKTNENTRSYQNLNDATLFEYSHIVYQQLQLWLDWQISSAEVAKLFWQVGQSRLDQSIPLTDLYYAVILARRNLYINILEKLGSEAAVDMEELIAFTSRITYFFDKIAYFVISGYTGESAPTPEDKTGLDDILTAFRAGSNPDM